MKSLVVVCAILAFASAGNTIPEVLRLTGAPVNGWGWAGGWPLAYAPIWAKSQYHSQDELGQAAFGHAQPGQAHNAVRDAAGNVAGSYSYVDPNGKVVVTDYVADSLGFRVASNALPEDLGVAPAPVEDTPEVAAARAEHLAKVDAARAAKIVPKVAEAVPVPVEAVPVPVKDTPEVAAARAAHLAEVEATRSRSKAGIVTSLPLVQNIISPITSPIVSPLALSAANPILSPLALSAARTIVSPLALGAPVLAAPSTVIREGTLTTVVNTPAHAESYRVD